MLTCSALLRRTETSRMSRFRLLCASKDPSTAIVFDCDDTLADDSFTVAHVEAMRLTFPPAAKLPYDPERSS